jgi:hypothetical protein
MAATTVDREVQFRWAAGVWGLSWPQRDIIETMQTAQKMGERNEIRLAMKPSHLRELCADVAIFFSLGQESRCGIRQFRFTPPYWFALPK